MLGGPRRCNRTIIVTWHSVPVDVNVMWTFTLKGYGRKSRDMAWIPVTKTHQTTSYSCESVLSHLQKRGIPALEDVLVTGGRNERQYQVEFMDNRRGQVDKCMVGKREKPLSPLPVLNTELLPFKKNTLQKQCISLQTGLYPVRPVLQRHTELQIARLAIHGIPKFVCVQTCCPYLVWETVSCCATQKWSELEISQCA